MSKINLRISIHSLYIWEFFEKVSQEFPKENVYVTLPLFLVFDCNNRLCVACTFSHIGQGNIHTKLPLPDFHRGWLGTTKNEDKKQLSIQNSQLGYTHARNSPANDWAEHQLDPGNHLGSRKGGKKHIQQMNHKSSSPPVCVEETKNFPEG